MLIYKPACMFCSAHFPCNMLDTFCELCMQVCDIFAPLYTYYCELCILVSVPAAVHKHSLCESQRHSGFAFCTSSLHTCVSLVALHLGLQAARPHFWSHDMSNRQQLYWQAWACCTCLLLDDSCICSCLCEEYASSTASLSLKHVGSSRRT